MTLMDELRDTDHAERFGRFSLFANLSLLDAEFTDGPRDGNTPSYAPNYLLKGGFIYRLQDRLKFALTGLWVDEHFWQDGNGAGSVGTATSASSSDRLAKRLKRPKRSA